MKSLSVISIFSLALCLSSASPFSSPSTDCAYPIGQGNGQNARAVGRLFEIDGQYFAGTNAWWLAHLSNNLDVDKALSEIASVSSILYSLRHGYPIL